jgi:hypothetical protein
MWNQGREEDRIWNAVFYILELLQWEHSGKQVHGLMLRELGGGFARHHRAPSLRTASYVVTKPAVLVDRIQIIKKLRGHRNAVYCGMRHAIQYFSKDFEPVLNTYSESWNTKVCMISNYCCLHSLFNKLLKLLEPQSTCSCLIKVDRTLSVLRFFGFKGFVLAERVFSF